MDRFDKYRTFLLFQYSELLPQNVKKKRPECTDPRKLDQKIQPLGVF